MIFSSIFCEILYACVIIASLMVTHTGKGLAVADQEIRQIYRSETFTEVNQNIYTGLSEIHTFNDQMLGM